MLDSVQFDAASDVPLYRQLYEKVKNLIESGALGHGVRLPATRELAGHLGLNRTTVSAAYELLEGDGLIRGHVGRGSFVHYEAASSLISFASSRPAEADFPIADFQTACREVIEGPEAGAILQLGSPAGYAPLRQYLLARAQTEGVAGPNDDILITSGCQQALDLLQRTQVRAGETVAIEDPVYHGVRNVFSRGGARLVGVPVGPSGIDRERLARTLAIERPRLLVVTPNFQNPTGCTMPLEARHAVLELAAQFGVTVAENDIYRELRYTGETLPSLKQLDRSGSTVLIRSFSKIAFPGLRVGWVIGPKPVIAEFTEARQWCDLHTDQLSQAVMLRFAQSGRLAAHLERVRTQGAQRLQAVLQACERHLPPGSSFTKPEGGMSLWVRLPEPLQASELLPRAQRENVSYLAGSLFAVSQPDPGSLRLSFGALPPDRIELGLARLGRLFTEELARLRLVGETEAASALV